MSDKIHVLFVMEDLCFGGTQRQMVELACRLDRSRFRVSMLVLTGRTDLDAQVEQAGIRVEYLGRSRKVNPFFFALMPAALKRLAPDVLVPCTALPNIWGRLWGRLLGIPIVGTVRGGGAPRRQHERFLWRLTDHMVCNSEALADVLSGLGIPAARLAYVPNGVDTERFRFDSEGRMEVRARYGFTDDECVVGLLGRFDLVKGQRETIAALAKLVGEGVRNIRLMLLGFSTATLQEEVEAWIREAGMERYVTITGKVPDVTACLSALDVGVVASLWSETIARAALEIMACGRPLVSTSVGVMPDLLPASALVAPGDVDALAGVLRRAATDEAWRRDLAGHCSERIMTLRDQDFLEQTLAVYTEACRRRCSS